MGDRGRRRLQQPDLLEARHVREQQERVETEARQTGNELEARAEAAMNSVLGYVVIEYNQASHRPGLPVPADMYSTRDEAEDARDAFVEHTRQNGRRETYRAAEVVLIDDKV